MGKVKAVKKSPPSKPLKISTSLFKRRVSRNSTNQKEKDTQKTNKATANRKKDDSKAEKVPRKRTSSPSPLNKVAAAGRKKPVLKMGKPTPKKKEEKEKPKKEQKSAKGRPGARKRDASADESNLKARSGRSSSISSTSSSSSQTQSESNTGSGTSTPSTPTPTRRTKKVTTCRQSKTAKGKKTESPKYDPTSSENEEEEAEESGEEDPAGSSPGESESGEDNESDNSNDDNSESKRNKRGKKPLVKKKQPTPQKRGRVSKVEVKKKPVITKRVPQKGKLQKEKESGQKKKEKATKGGKMLKKTEEKAVKEKEKGTRKSKLKPRPKKRMASLNAKAILEASFSFENQEKRQRSPGPSGAGTPTKGRDSLSAEELSLKKEGGLNIASVSVSTSPSSSSQPGGSGSGSFIPIQNLAGKLQDSGERKRKSGEGRRESTTSSGVKSSSGSRRASASTNDQKPGKQKNKVSVATASTSTGTSPPPQGLKKLKRKKVAGVDSGTSTEEGRGHHQEPTNQVKSSGSQAKERKSSSSVAHFGTVYQPAGPLIEPHKSPLGLPETVKLPADLKVTYQAHPPSSNVSTVSHPSSKASSSRRHGHSSSSTATSTSSPHSHHKDKSGQILHQPYKSSQSSSSRQSISVSGSSASLGYSVVSPGTATGSPLLGMHNPSSSQQLPSAVGPAGASSAGGLYYQTSTFAPHHSPYAPNKFPMVPPESYRTHSPYQNSFLYPSTTPAAAQQSQGFYMTPFYTPPLTPNPNPVMAGSLVGPGQVGRGPLSLTHPGIPTASFYPPQSAPMQPTVGVHHPSSYLVASPHHSLQPAPTAPGHAGLFPLNPSTQPACPCPTESCHPSSTTISSNKPQPQSASSVLHPVLPGGPKPSRGRGSRKNPPSACTTPTVLADTPPISIQPMSGNNESAKTFTEQYSLPDDITITPIIVNATAPTANTLLLRNTSISVVAPPTTSPKTRASTSLSPSGRRKEKDIVHVIDPRSGHKTTIAKHISNRNLLVKSNLKNGGNSIVSPGTKKIGVNKLNPDLDVIVINNNKPNGSANCDDSVTENMGNMKAKNPGGGLKRLSTPLPTRVAGNKRVVLTPNDNSRKPGHRANLQNQPVNYFLPPGISISPGVGGVQLQNRSSNNEVQVQTMQGKGRKRISLTECIDELQKKKLKLLENPSNGLSSRIVPPKVIRPANENSPSKKLDYTSSSARVRDPQLHKGGTVIRSKDALLAVTALVTPDTYQTKFPRLKNGLRRGTKLRGMGRGVGVGRNTRSAAAASNPKLRSRLGVNPPVNSAKDNTQPRYRSRLLRKGNQVIGIVVGGTGPRRPELDSSGTIRSNSAVRMVNGNGLINKGDRENRKLPTQAFINAVADLYQYKRNVLLRVPRSGVGVFPCARTVNLGKLPTPSSSPKSQLSPGSSEKGTPTITHTNVPIPTRSPVGSMAANAAKKRALVKPLSPAAINGALLQMSLARRSMPKWSNGWRFEGEPYENKVYFNNDDPPQMRRCYPAMRHESGDVIQTRDCVLLKSGSRKNDLPFIAKIAALWENPVDGEMMFSLLWYYRPEHTEMGRTKEDMPDEIFASKHIDVNSVATIDDRCFVLTFNEYCRYRKRLKQLQEGLPNKPLLSLSNSAMINNNAAGNIAGAVWTGRSTNSENPTAEPVRAPSPGKISPEVVFFCRKVYDFRQKRIVKNPS